MPGPLYIVQRVQRFFSQKNDHLVVGGGGGSVVSQKTFALPIRSILLTIVLRIHNQFTVNYLL